MLDDSDGDITDLMLEKYVTRFRYDSQNRLIEKKIPESHYLRYVYDNMDRVILTQDGNLRTNGQWMFTKYDRRGNVVMTGIYNDPNHLEQVEIQENVDDVGEMSGTTVSDYKNTLGQNYGE